MRLLRGVGERVGLPGQGREAGDARQFGTLAGVFVPTSVTILGVIMYLRLAWVVGNAGLVGAVLVVLLAHVVTITTGLAISSIATNIRVGAGGAFSIISQSLGLEVGGSVSILLYLALGISIALYIFGFTEGVLNIFPALPEVLVVFATFAVISAIAYISARLASRIQSLILAIIGFSLLSIFLGAFTAGRGAGLDQAPVLWGDFPDGDFWVIFSVFFPAVTGIMAGISLSGDLKDPRKSLPIGTMSAIFLGMAIYLLLCFWLARVAAPAEMLNTDPGQIVMVEKALWGWPVLAGLLGATFSSALASMVAAPRVMQALGRQDILPKSKFFARQAESGEPRNAMVVTGLITFAALLFALLGGGLNAIAPLITMFFMLTYGMINAVVLIEQSLGMVSFRPTFAIPRAVPSIGLISCLFVMFLINPIFSLLSIIFALGAYAYLLRKQLQAPWEDVRSGLFSALAEWASERASRMPVAPERTWNPNILAPVTSTRTMVGNYRFLRAITAPQGSVRALGLYPPGQAEAVADLDAFMGAFIADGIFARTTLLEAPDVEAGVRTAIEVLTSVFFQPNILFLPLFQDDRPIDLEKLLSSSSDFDMGVTLLARNPVVELGREQLINVWIREQGPAWQLGLRLSNMDLSVLLAYQLAGNWHGRINLCMAVHDQETAVKAQAYLEELTHLARLPSTTQVTIIQRPFRQALGEIPAGDINFFGLPNDFNPDFLKEIVDLVDASCLFVRDSGHESALA